MIPLIYQEDTDYLPRTEQIWVKHNEALSRLCHISKNLYNEANYIIRQEFARKDKEGNNCGSYLPSNIIDYLINNKSENYRKLPAKTAQQILKILDRNWKSFFGAMKEWKIHPEKFLGRPGLPGYLKKDGEFVLYFTDQQVRIIENNSGNSTIKFPKILNILNYKSVIIKKCNQRIKNNSKRDRIFNRFGLL